MSPYRCVVFLFYFLLFIIYLFISFYLFQISRLNDVREFFSRMCFCHSKFCRLEFCCGGKYLGEFMTTNKYSIINII